MLFSNNNLFLDSNVSDIINFQLSASPNEEEEKISKGVLKIACSILPKQ